ncbi:hypothetical protein [Evansella clarkii]|jgi:hypothetical protein|uniref:hypothetical protein n=1 Tax=Evansella clarkii TaxID=79879 RepID=UPI0009964417|nr:hypothetical protein [Evansella clarkii]
MKQEVKREIVNEAVKQIYDAYPALREKFGENGLKRTEEDNHHHLDHLETACLLDDNKYFTDYTEWLERVLTSRQVGTELIIDNFQRLKEIIPGKTDPGEEQAFLRMLDEAIAILKSGR